MQAAPDEWVTVFGFQPAQLQTVMREFSRCGDIQNFGSFREDHVNWVHIQYAVSLLALCPTLTEVTLFCCLPISAATLS